LVISFLRAMIDDFVWFCTDFTRKFSSIEKLWDFFDNNSEIRWLETGRDFVYKTGNIELKNIKFSYWDNTVFDDFSLKIKWNKITAFVGESGWWKTTLMKLISWFIEPSSWEIIIDDQKLSEINFMSYYKDIWYLTQDPSVFDGTILENLTYWSKEKITEKRLKEVIKKSKCEFIFDFKKWLDTEIWERWVRLSWWQKQRLAIAKIFLKNPKIIFLDEPTSALDSKSEKLLHESFEELFKWRTVIIIAHRLQTVKSADNIFVFEAGKIVENWTHNSLIRKWWYYKEMLDLQSGF
jgi:ABC-type multidrug transport system fused ATPase/permease subunit